MPALESEKETWIEEILLDKIIKSIQKRTTGYGFVLSSSGNRLATAP
jgi:hypothetical protein